MQPDLTDEDIETLDTFLMSEQAPEDCMLISDLDGFLTAIAIGPEPVPQAEWMPVVWDGDEPAFADAAQAERIQGLIVRRHDQIRHLLAEQPDAYAHWFWPDEADTPIAPACAEGLLPGLGLRPAAGPPTLDTPADLEMG